jgi:hypothetical protein
MADLAARQAGIIRKSKLQQCSAKFVSSFHLQTIMLKIIQTKKRIIINN